MPMKLANAARLLTALVFSIAGLCVCGCTANQAMLHPGSAAKVEAMIPTPASSPLMREEEVTVVNREHHTLHGRLAYNEGDRGVLLISPGNAESREQARWYTDFLRGQGFRLLVFSFQGFDDNKEGPADLHSLVGDAHAFYSLAKERFPGERIAYFANSISTAAALCMAQDKAPLDGLVLEGAFDPRTIPFSKVGQLWVTLVLFPISVPMAAFASITVPGNLNLSRCLPTDKDTPVLFIHNSRDIVTPYKTARRIFERYPGPKDFYDAQRTGDQQAHLSLQADAIGRKRVLEAVVKYLHP